MNRNITSCKIRQIINAFPNEKFEFIFNSNTNRLQMFLFQNKKPMIITFLPKYMSWKKIKKQIETYLTMEEIQECSICLSEPFSNFNFSEMRGSPNSFLEIPSHFLKVIENTRIFCSHCNNDCCQICYNNILEKNRGIFICPFCRNKYGKEMTREMVEQKIHLLNYRSQSFYFQFKKSFDNMNNNNNNMNNNNNNMNNTANNNNNNMNNNNNNMNNTANNIDILQVSSFYFRNSFLLFYCSYFICIIYYLFQEIFRMKNNLENI